ncbi:MAG: hypothetical protein MO846_00200 [Candidatus Devosia symbiotica]|nr:hypothetical protein [Candidatus Devosia symbiotica]
MRLFAIRQFAGANLLTVTLYFALTGVTFYLPMTLMAGWDAALAQVSAVMLPFTVAISLLSPFTGQLTDRYGVGPLITLGSLLVDLAFVGLAFTAPLQQIWLAVLSLMSVARAAWRWWSRPYQRP